MSGFLLAFLHCTTMFKHDSSRCHPGQCPWRKVSNQTDPQPQAASAIQDTLEWPDTLVTTGRIANAISPLSTVFRFRAYTGM